jgi:hypothetical protein
VQGTLAANSGGSFAYYDFAYPGDGSVASLTLVVDNPLPLEQRAAGFNVYGPGSVTVASNTISLHSATASYAGSTAGTVLVQVYNYNSAAGFNYNLTTSGVAGLTNNTPPALPTPTPFVVPVKTPTASSSTLPGPVSGTLPGNAGGSYIKFPYAYPAGVAQETVTLSIAPAYLLQTGYVNVQIYGSGGTLVSTGRPVSPGVATAVIKNGAGDYIVQVFNYYASAAISYSLSVAP